MFIFLESMAVVDLFIGSCSLFVKKEYELRYKKKLSTKKHYKN